MAMKKPTPPAAIGVVADASTAEERRHASDEAGHARVALSGGELLVARRNAGRR